VRKKPSAFPVGLYGMLLAALCWLTLPRVFAPIERWLVGSACAVGRVWASLAGEPAHAASADAKERLRALGDDLAARLRRHGAPGPRAEWARGWEPVHCAVVGLERRGGGGEESELRLDRSHAELVDCLDFVTKGDALVGTLLRPGRGTAVDDRPEDCARLVLPNHPHAQPLHAEVATPDGGWLRFVVRAAAAVDPAPLRVDLWDDPYRASRLDRADLPVRSRAVDGSASPLPAGLELGTTRIWGYPRVEGGESLTLGVFVVPAITPGAVSHVVAWRAPTPLGDDGPPPPPLARRAPHRSPAVLHDLPGAAHGRHLLVGAERVADGSAVVRDGYLVGTTKQLAFGSGLVTSFSASRQRWSLILLPDEPQSKPIEFQGEVVGVDGDRVWVRFVRQNRMPGERGGAPGPGHLFTGSNGVHCPAGLWIGRAAGDPRALDRLVVTVPVERGVRAVEVLTAAVAP
jgi:hypothetical protein